MMWYDIPEFPGYKINHRSEIMSLKQGVRIMKQTIDTKGYYVVGLRQNGKTKVIAVHLLMARTFLGPCPPGLQVRHGVDGPLNNRLGNLCYGTPSQNNYDQVEHGTHYEANRTACDQGHEYTEENTMWRWGKGGKAGGKKYRKCRKCHNASIAAQRAKLKAKTGLTYKPKAANL
jgi:HNH endonuclease